MRVLSVLARLGLFLALFLISVFCLLAIDIVAIPIMLDYPDTYDGRVSIYAIVIIAIVGKSLFKKTVQKRNITSDIVWLAYFVVCSACAISMTAIEQPELSEPFLWAGVIGIVVGQIILKIKEKSIE